MFYLPLHVFLRAFDAGVKLVFNKPMKAKDLETVLDSKIIEVEKRPPPTQVIKGGTELK
jgi:hypothetical protein